MTCVALRSGDSQAPTSLSKVDDAIAQLRLGAIHLASCGLERRIEWAESCIEGVAAVAKEWVEVACRAKRIPADSAARAEEVLTGPVSVVRFLRLTIRTFRDLQSEGVPTLPGKPRCVADSLRVPVFPTLELYDPLVFRGLTAETWLQPGVTPERMFGGCAARLVRLTGVIPRVVTVLGAGNVSAIPVTDTLTMILQNDCAVLLKMNPVNDYLGPLIERALQPLVQQGLLRIVYGGADVGGHAVQHPQIDAVHITGSIDTHDAIVWGGDPEQRRQRQAKGTPLVSKPVTSELGNVTPWAIVPGNYRPAELRAQAEHVVASITNNASFNCVATKMLITCRQWPDRERFLDLVESILASVPRRVAYYPGADERYEQFSGRNDVGPDDQGRLPWTMRRGVQLDSEPELFQRESFVCVAGETSIDADSPAEFLQSAVELMNERMWGTLAAALTVPTGLDKRYRGALDAALDRLRYGTVGINQWPGVAYALMSPPWGAFPGSRLTDVQSGRGFVHNTYLLERPQKTVLRSPSTSFPKPVWFSTHRCPEAVAWRLFRLYCRPSWRRIPGLLIQALRG